MESGEGTCMCIARVFLLYMGPQNTSSIEGISADS